LDFRIPNYNGATIQDCPHPTATTISLHRQKLTLINFQRTLAAMPMRDTRTDSIAEDECDGKTYHSSRAARDRDRLREKVLMERGWKLHRIWSTDWFVNPQQAKAKLIDAVNAACR
jgi:very-short-patch-repair endonuclease